MSSSFRQHSHVSPYTFYIPLSRLSHDRLKAVPPFSQRTTSEIATPRCQDRSRSWDRHHHHFRFLYARASRCTCRYMRRWQRRGLWHPECPVDVLVTFVFRLLRLFRTYIRGLVAAYNIVHDFGPWSQATGGSPHSPVIFCPGSGFPS